MAKNKPRAKGLARKLSQGANRPMRRLLLILTALAAPAAALAQDAQRPRTYAGDCVRLVAGGNDATRTCGKRLTRLSLPDGTGFFIFVSNKTLIGFSGRGGARGTLPLQFVNVGAPGREPNPIPATGQCRYEDVARGPAMVTCSAKTSQGAFEADFRTDGSAPKR